MGGQGHEAPILSQGLCLGQEEDHRRVVGRQGAARNASSQRKGVVDEPQPRELQHLVPKRDRGGGTGIEDVRPGAGQGRGGPCPACLDLESDAVEIGERQGAGLLGGGCQEGLQSFPVTDGLVKHQAVGPQEVRRPQTRQPRELLARRLRLAVEEEPLHGIGVGAERIGRDSALGGRERLARTPHVSEENTFEILAIRPGRIERHSHDRLVTVNEVR